MIITSNKKLERLYLNDNHIKQMSDALLNLRCLKYLRLDKNLISRISGYIILILLFP